jgi:hypothetical protein
MVSPNESSFNLREIHPLSRNILHSRTDDPTLRESERTQRQYCLRRVTETGQSLLSVIKVSAGYLNYPADARDTAKSGMGCMGNRHLRYFAESISVNVGGSEQNDKPVCTPQSEQARVAIGSISRLKAHTEASELLVNTLKGSSLPMSVLSVGGVIVV